MTYQFGVLSKERLEGVHQDLRKVFYAALEGSPYDFSITEGLRTYKRQKMLVEAGKSQTMNSRHLTGHAVDFCIIIDGKADWDLEKYHKVTDHIKNVASKLNIPIVCGIDWKTLKDGPHVELDRSVYK
jgi:peptidoglycan L-alanyl-D-glutamate endopeptidase CwlK